MIKYWPYLRASPTVLQIGFAFMYLQKSLKNTYPMVFHLDFAILLTWQKEGKDWHICQACSHLALENWREVRARLRVEVARVWRHPAARLFCELPIGLPSMRDSIYALPIVCVFTYRSSINARYSINALRIVFVGKNSSRQTPSGYAQTSRPQRLGGNKFAANIHPTHGEEKSSAKKLCGSIIFFFWQMINVKPLEIASFHICHIFLKLGKLPHLPNQLCKTVEDALRFMYTKVMTFKSDHIIHTLIHVSNNYIIYVMSLNIELVT